MKNLIYNVFHDIAVKRNAVEDMWGAALTTISPQKFPKFDRLRSAVTVLVQNITAEDKP